MKQWVCRVCRYAQAGDAPPDACPVCKSTARGFDEIDEGVTEPEIRRPLSLLMPLESTLWRCQVCGLEHRGPRPPDICPVCGVGPELWDRVDAPRPRMDTDPTSLVDTMTCAVCGTHVGGAQVETCQLCGARQVWLSAPPNIAGSHEPPRPSSLPREYVVIGSGIAALRAAEAIRANDGAARIVMLTREPCLPYNRLNLTRFLDGDVDTASTMLHPPEWYAEHGIEVRLETDVVSIHTRERNVRTRTRDVRYDRLVIATGARVAIPPIANIWIDGVQPLRTLHDCAHVLAASGVGRRVVVLGGGVLGLEAAAALRRRGCEVTVCERGEHVMRQQLDVTAARLLQKHMEQQGIRFVLGRKATAIEGDESVQGVRLSGAAYEPADLVLVATGIVPNAALARSAGLTTGRGIVVDDTCQTSDPNVYAAGDAAEHRGITHGLWPTAMEMGSIAGANAAGGAETFFPKLQASFLKVVGIDLCAVGRVTAETQEDRELVHTEAGGAIFQKVVLNAGRLVGGILLGNTHAISALTDAIRSHRDVSAMAGTAGSIPAFLSLLANATPHDVA